MSTALRLASAAAALAALSACEPVPPAQPAGPVTGWEGGIPYGTYTLVGFGKEAVPTRDGTVSLQPGQISGKGPCNTYTATNAAQLPAIRISVMNWSDIQCPNHHGFEAKFFQALTQATGAQWQGGVLKIIGPTYMTLERTGD